MFALVVALASGCAPRCQCAHCLVVSVLSAKGEMAGPDVCVRLSVACCEVVRLVESVFPRSLGG